MIAKGKQSGARLKIIIAPNDVTILASGGLKAQHAVN